MKIREELKCKVFSSGKQADAVGTPFSALTPMPAVSCHIFLAGRRNRAELWEFCCTAQAPAFGKGLGDIPVGGLLFAKAAKKIAAANKSIGAMATGGRNMINKPLIGRIGNRSEKVMIREEVKCSVFS